GAIGFSGKAMGQFARQSSAAPPVWCAPSSIGLRSGRASRSSWSNHEGLLPSSTFSRFKKLDAPFVLGRFLNGKSFHHPLELLDRRIRWEAIRSDAALARHPWRIQNLCAVAHAQHELP